MKIGCSLSQQRIPDKTDMMNWGRLRHLKIHLTLEIRDSQTY
jgi:hypothetical protein